MLSDGVDASTVYEQLYADHAGAVLTYLTNRLRDPDVAEDVSQTTWLKAHRFLPDVLSRGDTAGKPWLMRIARNAMTDHWRAAKARPQTIDIDDALAPGTAFPAALMDSDTPEYAMLAGAEHSERRATAAVLLELLPRHYRRVLWLREWRGFDYDHIASALKTTPSSVRSMLFRLRTLQREYGVTAVALADACFWKSAQKHADRDGCWAWPLYVNEHTPPRFYITTGKGTRIRVVARRYAYARFRGPLPPWGYLHGSCGNERCVSPWHAIVVAKNARRAGAVQPGGHYAIADPALDQEDAPARGSNDEAGRQQAGDDLRTRRHAVGATQELIARRAGVGETVVQRYEQGLLPRPELERAVLLAIASLEHELPAIPALSPGDARRRRRALRLSQKAMSVKAGVSVWALTQFELSRPLRWPNTIRLIAEALDRLEAERSAA